MDELYSSLPLEKVESLEDLVTIGPPGLVKVNYLSCNTSFARAFFFSSVDLGIIILFF